MREARERRRPLTVGGWVIRDLVRSRLLLAVCVWSPLGAQGQASQPERVALVVGNNNYEHISRLSNPTNDASDMATVLARLGFRVTRLLNASHADFNAALKEFARKSETAAIALVFYAGHGMEMDGVNYVLPVDARLKLDTQVPFETLTLDQVLASTAGAGLRLVILDSCRNVPQISRMVRTRGSRSVSRGSFGALDASRLGDETLVAYAAAAGTEAADGTGQRNSPYTAALLSELEQPKELGLLFRAARRQVLQSTNGQQQPHEYHSLRTEHFLAGKQPEAPSSVEVVRAQHETEFWKSIQESEESADYEAYLRQYPQGSFAELSLERSKKYREKEIWEVSQARNTLEAFLAYLRQYPKGRFAERARGQVQELADAKADDGETGLHFAAENNAEGLARVLLAAGAAVDAKEMLGRTPLHLTALENAEEVARVLLAARGHRRCQEQRRRHAAGHRGERQRAGCNAGAAGVWRLPSGAAEEVSRTAAAIAVGEHGNPEREMERRRESMTMQRIRFVVRFGRARLLGLARGRGEVPGGGHHDRAVTGGNVGDRRSDASGADGGNRSECMAAGCGRQEEG